MLAKHWRLLSVFAGGCLSGAMMIVGYRGDSKPSAERAEPQDAPLPSTAVNEEERVASASSLHAGLPAAVDIAGPSPPAAPHPVNPQESEHGAESTGADAGRSVADVLLHLEAAYRQKLADVSAPAQTAPHAEAAAPAPAASVAAAPVPSPPAPQAPASTVVVQAPVAVVPVAAPVLAAAPAAAAPPSTYPAPAAQPAAVSMVATRAPAPPGANPLATTLPAVGAVSQVGTAAQVSTVTQVGVVPQNVHLGDTHYGDTYQVQQVIQYVPMYAPYPYGAYGGYPAPTNGHSNQPKRVPYPTTLTNPDNPWGYNFPNALWTVR